MRVMYKLHVPLNNSSTLPAFYRCGKLNMLELVTIMESWNHKQRGKHRPQQCEISFHPSSMPQLFATRCIIGSARPLLQCSDLT